jgi:hypothetical protein
MNASGYLAVAVCITICGLAAGGIVGLRRFTASRLARPALAGPRGRSGRGRRDAGASALEWAVISAILITAAVLIGGVIYNVVNEKKDDINSCGSLGADAQSC